MLGYEVSVLLALVVLVTYSIGDTLAKRIVEAYHYPKSAALVTGISMIPFIAAFFVLPPQPIKSYSVALAAVAGIFYGLGFIFLYKSLSTEQTTNTMALSEFFKATLVLFGVFVFANHLTIVQSSSIALIFVGALLIIMTEKLRVNKKLLYALVGFIFWAVLWVTMQVSINSSQSWLPEGLIASALAFVVSFAWSLAGGSPRMRHKSDTRQRANWSSIVVGIAVGVGSLIFCYLLFAKFLAVGSAIIALSPVIVAVASRKLYLDKLIPIQLTGLVIMVLAALALSLASYI